MADAVQPPVFIKPTQPVKRSVQQSNRPRNKRSQTESTNNDTNNCNTIKTDTDSTQHNNNDSAMPATFDTTHTPTHTLKHRPTRLNAVSPNVFNPNYSGFGKRHRIHAQKFRTHRHNRLSYIRQHGVMSTVLPRLISIIENNIAARTNITQVMKLCIILLNAYKLNVDVVFRATVYCLKYIIDNKVLKRNEINNNIKSESNTVDDTSNTIQTGTENELQLLGRFYRRFLSYNPSNRLHIMYEYVNFLLQHKQYLLCYNYLHSKIEEGHPWNRSATLLYLCGLAAYKVCVEAAEQYNATNNDNDDDSAANNVNNKINNVNNTVEQSDSDYSSIRNDSDEEFDYSHFDDPDAYAARMSQRQENKSKLAIPPSPAHSIVSTDSSIVHPHAQRAGIANNSNPHISQIQQHRSQAIKLLNQSLYLQNHNNGICVYLMIKSYFDFIHIVPHSDNTEHNAVVHIVTQYRRSNTNSPQAFSNELLLYQTIDPDANMPQQAYLCIQLLRLDPVNTVAHDTMFTLFNSGAVNSRYMFESLMYQIDHQLDMNDSKWQLVNTCLSQLVDSNIQYEPLRDMYVEPIKHIELDDNNAETINKPDDTSLDATVQKDEVQPTDTLSPDHPTEWLGMIQHRLEKWQQHYLIQLKHNHHTTYKLLKRYSKKLSQTNTM